MEGLLPTSKGNIIFSLWKSDTKLLAKLMIPDAISGEILWNGNQISLKEEKHNYVLE